LTVPHPTLILRLIHIDNLHICLQRGGLYAPNSTLSDGLQYRTIHNLEVQQKRQMKSIPCGPGGVVHDYVPFYFGYLSPMMLNLRTGRVPGYNEGQEPLIYLTTTCQAIQDSGTRFVFTDGHGIAAWTRYFDALAQLDQVDWNMVYQRYWRDTDDDMDRQRRKQAEFLVHRFCSWSLVQEIIVIDGAMKARVEQVMAAFPPGLQRVVRVQREWYYY
jgi:hypothetical protein